MQAIIRPFMQADQASLGEAIDTVCGEGCWMSTSRFEPTPAWAHALEVPACPDHLLLVAEDGGRVVGWCRLFPLVGCNGPTGGAKLGIGLLPAYRGHGLGKALLGQTLDWAIDRGVQRATLTVRTDNARAIRIFERCGFRKTGREGGGCMEMNCRPRPLGG